VKLGSLHGLDDCRFLSFGIAYPVLTDCLTFKLNYFEVQSIRNCLASYICRYDSRLLFRWTGFDSLPVLRLVWNRCLFSVAMALTTRGVLSSRSLGGVRENAKKS
jgi:hypothetical protein